MEQNDFEEALETVWSVVAERIDADMAVEGRTCLTNAMSAYKHLIGTLHKDGQEMEAFTLTEAMLMHAVQIMMSRYSLMEDGLHFDGHKLYPEEPACGIEPTGTLQ